jgi:hypothetical protein
MGGLGVMGTELRIVGRAHPLWLAFYRDDFHLLHKDFSLVEITIPHLHTQKTETQ